MGRWRRVVEVSERDACCHAVAGLPLGCRTLSSVFPCVGCAELPRKLSRLGAVRRVFGVQVVYAC